MRRRGDIAVQAKLIAITDSRKVIAAMRLADADRSHSQAGEALNAVSQKAVAAYDSWLQCLGSNLLGPQAVRSFANHVLAAESELIGVRKQHEATQREAEERQREFLSIEARLQAEHDRLRRSRRRLASKIEERKQDDAADRTASKWFQAR